jgi:hypothetical protein
MSSKKNNNFKRDYRDICYFIDHVKDIDFRISLIRSLGYKIGVNIVRSREEDKEKTITVGKRNEYRIQIAPLLSHSPLVQCAIVE